MTEQYKLVLKDLITELDYTQDVLKRIESGEFHEGVDRIMKQYRELFCENHTRHKNLISDHIEFKTSNIGKSTLFYSSENNTTKHITLRMVSEEAINLDTKYSNRITDLIQFFKQLFSALNNYQIYRNHTKLSMFVTFIDEIKNEIDYFLTDNTKNREQQAAKLLEIKKVEKEEDSLKERGQQFKSDYEAYAELIRDRGIKYLYHFTSKDNIGSIKSLGGLYSWPYFSIHGKNVSAGGHNESRLKDAQKGYEDYVRLSFCEKHPMSFSAKKDGRLKNFVVLKLKPELLYHLGTRYSNKNAIVKNVEIQNNISILKSFDFSIFKKYFPNLRDYKEKDQYQAEVLVRHHIPIEYIVNIEEV